MCDPRSWDKRRAVVPLITVPQMLQGQEKIFGFAQELLLGVVGGMISSKLRFFTVAVDALACDFLAVEA